MANVVNLYLLYRIVKDLSTPFDETEAFKLGLIDEKGKRLKKAESKEEKEVEDNDGVLHKGIAKRSFSKGFTIADDVEVKGAELKDGLLKVSLEKIVPDHKKARTINIK